MLVLLSLVFGMFAVMYGMRIKKLGMGIELNARSLLNLN